MPEFVPKVDAVAESQRGLASRFEVLATDTKTTFAHLNPGEFFQRRFVFSILGNPLLNWLAIKLTPILMSLGPPARFVIRHTILAVFCGGENIGQVVTTARKMEMSGVNAILDYASEEADSSEHYEKNARIITEMIRSVTAIKGVRRKVAVKYSSLIDKEILKKIQARVPVDRVEFRELRLFMRRVAAIGEEAVKCDVSLLIDAEEVSVQHSLDLVTRFLMRRCNQTAPIVYTTIQAYLRDTESKVDEWLLFAKSRKVVIGIKLVRGAYLEQERKWAAEKQVMPPVWDNKVGTDKTYNLILDFLIRTPHIGLIIATHNVASTRIALKLIGEVEVEGRGEVSFAQLQGMSDNITFALAAMGLPVAKYLPFAPVKEMIPYLLRRARENRSVMGETAREVGLIRAEVKRRRVSPD